MIASRKAHKKAAPKGGGKGMRKMISVLKEIVSVQTEDEVNEYLAKGWKLLKVFEPKEFIMARYENKEKEIKD